MKTVIKTIIAVVAMTTLLFQGSVVASVIEGRVFKVDNLRNTFQVTPVDEGSAVTSKDIFIVSPSTEMEGVVNLREIDVGDRVEVVAHAYNEVVWGAETLKVK